MGFLSKLLGVDARNAELASWGNSVAVTAAQAQVMSILWKASKAKTPPQSDPLSTLAAEDRASLKRICSADFRPRQFGNSDVMRGMTFSLLTEKGFTAEQAAVITGMTFNMVGPVD